VWRRGWRMCLLRRWLGLPAGMAPRSGRRLASPVGVFGSYGTTVTGNLRRRWSRMARGGRRGVLRRLAPGLAVAGDPGGLHRAGGGARGLVFLSAACGVCSGREGIPLRCGLGASFPSAQGRAPGVRPAFIGVAARSRSLRGGRPGWRLRLRRRRRPRVKGREP
jgi:hypothetical protein